MRRWTLIFFQNYPWNFDGSLKFWRNPHWTLTNPHFLRKAASVETCKLIGFICRFPKLWPSELCYTSIVDIPCFLSVEFFVLRFSRKERVAQRRLVSHFPLSKGYRGNLPVLAWWNSCSLPTTSTALPVTCGDRQGEIISRRVSTLFSFLTKRGFINV